MPDVTVEAIRWSIVIPVKRLRLAKSRLAVDRDQRAELAIAMAIDTVRAALDSAAAVEVMVVTDDGRAAEVLRQLGARVVGDDPDSGLNPALRHGASLAATPAVAALASDLPALRSSSLDAVLEVAAASRRSAVADAGGTGTTLLAARAGDLRPEFGPASFMVHLAGGATDLTGVADPRLRQDVDTVTALRTAVALGVGEATAGVLAAHPDLLG